MHPLPHLIASALALGLVTYSSPLVAQGARITEETRVIKTYPFSEPNPVPILTRDSRLYPYHSFEGYATEGVPREWKVIRLENEHIEVFVLPEVGGKVWGAVVKKSGHEFIYRNEVMKFRNIALRGPWTSGGIEFNFGVIGHTPSTATPVDYRLLNNPDGSVSVVVGAMDLPSRTHWRVEIRLPADRAYFETNVLWYNPTPLAQPYYNWMTAAAFARNDLEMSIPGNAFLEHPGAKRGWPVNPDGRYLPAYANNTFAGHKSYHVVGEFNDFFGGYYRDDDYGFGHWSRYEEMPGQKLWLWALSRQGGVWEELLTDADGQYVEYQAGRLLVQYSPGSDVNPITQAEFDPGAADRWSETWFPLEGIGGLTDASRDGAMHVERNGRRVVVRINSFGDVTDTLRVTYANREITAEPISFATLEAVERTIALPGDGYFQIELSTLGLKFTSDRETRALDRPFATDASARAMTPKVDRWVFEARELVKGRYYGEARKLFGAALTVEPWNKEALLGLADLEYRRARHRDGMTYVNAALQLDAYDAKTNFIAGNLHHALGDGVNATEAYGWAARAIAFRSISYVRLAEIKLAASELDEAARYAQLAMDYDRYNVPARQVLAIIARMRGDTNLADTIAEELMDVDPLQHFVMAETYLANPTANSAQTFTETLQGEFADQIILELAIDYLRRGATEDAKRLIQLGENTRPNPILRAWQGWIDNDPSALDTRTELSFMFPYRVETVPILEWAVEQNDHWSWRYLLALNLWARDRENEAAVQLSSVGNDANFAPLYVARASLLARVRQQNPEDDLRRAAELSPDDRMMQIHLIRFLQDRGRWEEALTVSAANRSRFPNDFNLDLLHVRSLNNLGRGGAAVDILDVIHVLPSESARESHRLYEQAHTLVALDAMERGSWETARAHLSTALEWPERLGQGRPYEPEERLVRYLLAQTEHALGNENRSRIEFESVIKTGQRTNEENGWHALTVSALAFLDRLDGDTASDHGYDTMTQTVAAALYHAVKNGNSIGAGARQIASDHPEWFTDLDGQLLLRALLVSTERR